MDTKRVQVLSQYVADNFITAEQLGFLILQNSVELEQGLAALKPLFAENVAMAQTAVRAMLQAKGFRSAVSSSEPPLVLPSTIDADFAKPDIVQEVTIVCIDVSGSMRAPFESDRDRLEAVKQMFYGFRDQTSAYPNSSAHRIGLLSYDNKIQIHTKPTNNFQVFEDVVDDMECRGSTAIYEAISAACDMLAPWKASHPTADLRVICLSDGQNNCHNVTAETALQRLFDLGALCDCMIVGKSPDASLLRLVAATEGICFQLDSLASMYECLESQAVVSLAARRNGAPKPAFRKKTVPASLTSVKEAKAHRGALVVPQLASTPTTCVELPQFTSTAATGAQKRIQLELKKLQATVGPMADPNTQLPTGFHFFPAVNQQGHVDELKILMEGPFQTPYAGGAFELSLNFPANYPFSAPTLRFVTPIYHYAVNTQGRMCLALLHDLWSPAVTLIQVLSAMHALVANPKGVDPNSELSQRSWLSELLRVDAQTYADNAVAATTQDAAHSVVFHRQRLISSSASIATKGTA
jgi:ubiquitin-protein ligase